MVTNPVANLKLAVGRAFPYLATREAGVHVASVLMARDRTTHSTCSPT